MSSPRQRQDIQSLRGYAVLLVVLYHARLVAVPAGYLGVDVFFVISGFLMTGLVVAEMDQGAFSFGAFYYRRAKRLLPALYAVMAAVALAAPWLLASRELLELRPQLLGGLTFTANLALERQAGYFDGAAELKPLLHLWSLSLEEQFYLLLPAALLLIPARWRLGVLSLSVVVSYGYSQSLAGTTGAFYGLASRSWELLLGGVGALCLPHARGAMATHPHARRAAVALALGGLLLMPLRTLPFPHPGPQAALVTIATLVVLLGGSQALGAIAPLRWLGDRSYSLYLVHWPLFAMFHNAWMGPTWTRENSWARAGLVLVSLALADLLYRVVERPIHRAPWRPTRSGTVAGLGATAMVAVVAFLATRRAPGLVDFAFERRPNVGFAAECDHVGRQYEPRAACRNAEAPELMVWGDSFAMHLVPGLLATPGGAPAMVQATKSSCAPLLGLGVLGRPRGPRGDALTCIASNDSVVAYLARTPSITTVVLSSVLAPQVRTGGALLVRSATGQLDEVPPSVSVSLAHLEETANTVRRLGRRVVLVGPTPSSGVDLARCAERRVTGLPTVGARPDCAIATAGSFGLWPEVRQLLADAERRAVPVIRLSDVLCTASVCRTRSGQSSLYRDEAHLSYRGSVEVATQLRLAERVRRDAR